jgi:FIMAH domain-containing protein
VADLQALIQVVTNLNKKQGITNSLDAKLQNAQAALTSAKAGQRQNAINQLQAFINEVNAQRGKALSIVQADLLVKMASEIIAQL